MAKKDFQIIKMARRLCADIADMQGTADKRYRSGICTDMRKLSEEIMYSIRNANGQPAGSVTRINIQMEICEGLEKLIDLNSVVCGLINSGREKEAQVELLIENLRHKVNNWMKSDLLMAVNFYEKQINNQLYIIKGNKDIKEKVENYFKANKTASVKAAYEEAASKHRTSVREYKKLIEDYDKILSKYYQTRERNDRDDTELGRLLKSEDFKKFIN